MSKIPMTPVQKTLLNKIKDDKKRSLIFKQELKSLYSIKNSFFPQELCNYVKHEFSSKIKNVKKEYNTYIEDLRHHRSMDFTLRKNFIIKSKHLRTKIKSLNLIDRVRLGIYLKYFNRQFDFRYRKSVSISVLLLKATEKRLIEGLILASQYAQLYEEIYLIIKLRSQFPYELIEPNKYSIELRTDRGSKELIALPVKFFNELNPVFTEIWEKMVYQFITSYPKRQLPFVTLSSENSIRLFNEQYFSPYKKRQFFDARRQTIDYTISYLQSWVKEFPRPSIHQLVNI